MKREEERERKKREKQLTRPFFHHDKYGFISRPFLIPARLSKKLVAEIWPIKKRFLPTFPQPLQRKPVLYNTLELAFNCCNTFVFAMTISLKMAVPFLNNN